MNYYETKRYLNRGYMAKQRILSKQERIERWRAEITNATVRLDPEKVGNSTDKQQLEKTVIAISELSDSLQKDIEALAKIEKGIQDEINTFVDEPVYKTVLELRYLNYFKWESICERLHYSPRQVFRYHKQAVFEFCEKMAVNGSKWQ